MHCPSAHPSRVRAEFLEALASIAPAGLDRFLPAMSGAMANEIAIAIARTHRGGAIVSFAGSYFGRSAGTVGFAGKARYREALGLPAGGPFVPFPYPLRMGAGATDISMEALERLPGPIAAVILEPIQGNGGVVIPPADFLPPPACVLRPHGRAADRRRDPIGLRPHRPACGRSSMPASRRT